MTLCETWALEPDGVVELERGGYLFRRDDPADRLFQVESGRVVLARVSPLGRELILARSGPGVWVAEAALHAERYHCDCRAELRSQVRVFEQARVVALFRERPEVALSFMGELSREVRRLRALLEVRLEPSAEARILAYVAIVSNFEPIDPKEDGASAVRVALVRGLAGDLGLAEATVYRVLGDLRDRGVLEVDRKAGPGVILRGKSDPGHIL